MGAVQRYGRSREITNSTEEVFNINESVGDKYGNIPDLLFNDEVRDLEAIDPSEQLYRTVLKKTFGSSLISPQENINGIRRCEIQEIRLCVTSEPEFEKCQRMRTALNAQLLKPRMNCVPSTPPFSHRSCMKLIRDKRADIVMLTADYQLLCKDGTRKKATEYRDCYLGKVKANAMVTNPEYPPHHIDAFINLFKYAQQFYGQKMKNEFSFSMFYSEPPFADLIFQDAAQKIIVLPKDQRNYQSYLGKEFAKAYEE